MGTLSRPRFFLFSTFVSGYLIGLIVIYILHRFFGQEFYLVKIWVAIKFLGIYLYQLITSSLSIIKYILFKTKDMNPGLLTYETELKVIGPLHFNHFNYYYAWIDSD